MHRFVHMRQLLAILGPIQANIKHQTVFHFIAALMTFKSVTCQSNRTITDMIISE